MIRVLVFDVGGVIVELDWHGKVSQLLGRDIPFEQIHALWQASPSVNDFEHGRSTFDEFTTAFVAEQNLTLSKEQFQQDFHDIIVGDFPGICELLAELRQQFKIALLSNTNAAHWQRFEQTNTFLQHVDFPFTSLKFELMKPNPAIYQRLITELDCRPEEILFFDDGLANIEAARAEGINAERVFGPDDIKAALTKRGLYPSKG
jgi:putative hydrolase of the HAD superfamily